MKKRSKFVQQQKYNEHLQRKAQSNMNHALNRSNNKIEKYKQDYDNSIREIMSDFLKENDLNPDSIPYNSRILIYELLRKNIKTKLEEYNIYIAEHSNDENILEYYDAQRICKESLEQIDWIYNWTKPISHYDYDSSDGENYKDLLEEANNKLKESDKKFEEILDIPEIIRASNKDCMYEFYRFCRFICKNDLDRYYIYISNTIKNLKIISSEDPIVDIMFKSGSYKKSEDCEK